MCLIALVGVSEPLYTVAVEVCEAEVGGQQQQEPHGHLEEGQLRGKKQRGEAMSADDYGGKRRAAGCPSSSM